MLYRFLPVFALQKIEKSKDFCYSIIKESKPAEKNPQSGRAKNGGVWGRKFFAREPKPRRLLC
jgi:hypothetical protein